MGKRICIVGFSEVNRSWASQQPKGVEIWALNEVHNCTQTLVVVNELGQTRDKRCPCYNPHRCVCDTHPHIFINRYDRWFQLHPKEWKDEVRLTDFAKKGLTIHPKDRNTFGRNAIHWKFLKECDVPVYTQKKWRGIPNSVRYPFSDMAKTLGIKHQGPFKGKKFLYTTSTPAYMIALALHEHLQGVTLDEIRLAGIELAIGTEYFWQRPCMEYYMGMATGMGIKVTLPPKSAMLGAPRYAIDEPIPIPKDFHAKSFDLLHPTPEHIEKFGMDEALISEGAAGG